MVKTLAGETVQEVVAVKPVKIDMNVCQGCARGYASLEAETVTIRTRRILESDKAAHGGLELAYPILANVYYRSPAFTLEHFYSGRDFDGKSLRFVNKDLSIAVLGGFSL